MSLNYVNLVLDFYDGRGSPVQVGSVICTPNVTVTDSADHVIVTQAPINVRLFGNPTPTVRLVATDNSGLVPTGWGWLIQPEFPGAPAGELYLVSFSNGPTQYLSQLMPSTTAPAITTYFPASGGTFTGPVILAADPTTALGAATKQYADTKLAKSLNLSDVASASTSRTNLGLGTAATLAASAVAQTANNLSDLASASTARANLGAEGVRTPTAVQTGTSYTATAGQFAKIDSTAGAYSVTLPIAPADKTVVGVKLVKSAATVNAVTISSGGGDTFNLSTGGTTLTLSLLNQGVLLQYNTAATCWDVHADDLPLGQLDARYQEKPKPTDLVVYVSKNGNDSSDGLSWGSAKLTVGAGLGLLTAGGLMHIGAGTFNESGLALPAGGEVIMRGVGSQYPTRTQIQTGGGSGVTGDLFTVPASCFSCVFEDLNLTSNVISGGHLFNASTSSVSGFVWQRCYLIQENDAKCIWFTTDATFINCTIRDCYTQHTNTATVPSWWLISSGGGLENNTWENIWHTQTGNYYVLVNSTSASAYADGMSFRNFVWEQCCGGLIKLLGVRYSTLENMIAYDNSATYVTILNDGYYFGRGTTGNLACWGVDARSLVRLSGTLSSRSDTGCGTTSGSTTVTDAAAITADLGRQVTNANIPAGTYITAVAAGTGYTLSAAATATASSQTFAVQLAVDIRCFSAARSKISGCAGAIDLNNSDVSTYDLQWLAQGTTVLNRNPVQSLDISSINGSIFPSLAVSGLTSGTAAASRWVGGTVSGAPASGAHLAGDFSVDQSGKVWVCTAAGTPGTWATSSGGVTLDSTSTDIAALGTQAAGAVGKAADAGHVHPTTGVILSGATAGGDLSGTLPSPTVAKVNGVAVTGTPSSGMVPTATSGTAATWQTPASGFSNPMTTLGDIITENSTPAAARLAGSTSATKNFLTQTGNGTVSAVPAWGTIAAGDVPTLNQNTTGTAAGLSVTLAVASGGTGSGTRNFAGLLTPTAVKTSAYNAVAGDFVPVDMTSGSVTVTLPNSPANLTVIGVKMVVLAGANTVTIARSGSDVFNVSGGSTSMSLTRLFQTVVLEYSSGIWYAWATDPAMALDTTAGDIAALGAQAAGSTGKAADAGHVHPTTGLVTGVTATDTSVVVGGTSQAPTVATGTLDVIATQHAPAANWSNNSHKITSLANGSGAQDAAAFGQIPVIDATSTDIAALGTQAAGATGKTADAGHVHTMPSLNQLATAAGAYSMGSNKLTSLSNGTASSDAAAFGQIPVIDSTATDIVAVGTQAAGATGKAADAGHVHPTTSFFQQFTSSGSVTPVAGTYQITCVGAGAGGAGGGSTSTATAQAGGGGGGSGATSRQVVVLGSSITLTVTIGAGGAGGAGAAANGAAGSNGTFGASTTVTGTGVSVTAIGGSPGRHPTASLATAATGGGWGAGNYNVTNAGIASPGMGQPSAAGGLQGGGAPVDMAGGGGGAGGSANTTTSGGSAGRGGTATAGGTVGTDASSGSAAGGVASATTSIGAGGGGGGGGAQTTGTGGTGGTGGPGLVTILRVA